MRLKRSMHTMLQLILYKHYDTPLSATHDEQSLVLPCQRHYYIPLLSTAVIDTAAAPYATPSQQHHVWPPSC